MMAHRLLIVAGLSITLSAGLAEAETKWWDWEYNGDVAPAGSNISGFPMLAVGGPTTLMDCPECIGGKYLHNETTSKWNGGLSIQTGNPAQGFWPSAASAGCPGEPSNDINDVAVPGKYGPGTGWGNPSCMPGGATVEVRYRWTCGSPGGPPCIIDSEGLMPFAYPPMQYQALLRTDNDRGDYIQFAWWGSAGARPEIDIGDDWLVTRMVFGSSLEGLDYYVHDDGSLEEGTALDRGALWTANGPFRDELVRLIDQPNVIFGGHDSQEGVGWKGFESAGGELFQIGTGGTDANPAEFDLDYIRWVFDKRVAPSEPSTLTGDVNQDGVVDSADVAAFCDEFKLQEPGDNADVDDQRRRRP